MTIVILWYKYKFIHYTTRKDEIAISHKLILNFENLNEIDVFLKWYIFIISLHTSVTTYVAYKYV